MVVLDLHSFPTRRSSDLEDKELAEFYRKLMISEANHYTMFLGFARKYGNREEVDQKWNDLLSFEAEVMKDLGKHQRSEEHTSELQSRPHLVCRLLLEKKK